MRMHLWTEEMIASMREAAEYGSYYHDLAQILLPYLKESDRVCDAGCGMGQLVLELAPHVQSITAIDRNPAALEILQKQKEGRGIKNIEIRFQNLEDVRVEQPFDAMIFSLFGSDAEIEAAASRLCRGKVFVIRRRKEDALWLSRFADPRCPLAKADEPNRICFDLPLNQPLRDLEAARKFLKMYRTDTDWDTKSDAEIEAMLRPIRHEKYRYELPVTRHLELKILNR